MTREELREELEEQLRANCMCDFIAKREMMDILDDFDKWSEDAKNGDTYYYDGYEYTLVIEYEVQVWRNAEQREIGEPTYMTPTCSSTDLEAIKREVESYDIESTGCIEIGQVMINNEIMILSSDWRK